MKRVLISSLKGGEVLAQEVWDDRGVQWLAEGTTYKQSYLNKLYGLGINHIYIKQDSMANNFILKEEFNPNIIRSEGKELIRRQFKRFKNHGSINVYKFEKFVFTIMNEVMESTNIIDNLYDIKEYNYYTYEHSVNVTIIAIILAKQMNLSKYETYEIAMGCILHDLGKIQIKDTILNKATRLTVGEFNEIKKHPVNGYNIIKNNRRLDEKIKEIVLTHHEKLDGSGYPLGIAGDEISIATRICSIADVFDAMCSQRPYKMAVSFAEGVRTMRVTMDKQLDMDICTLLEEMLK